MIPDRFHPDVSNVVRAVCIQSPTRYSICGEQKDFAGLQNSAPGRQPGGASGKTGNVAGMPEEPVFKSSFENDIYMRLYARSEIPAGTQTDFLVQRDFVNLLSQANTGHGTWEPGWQVGALERDGSVSVRKNHVCFWVTTARIRTINGTICPENYCRVWIGKEMRQLIPGFYMAIGDGCRDEDRDTEEPLVRFYWHLRHDAAPGYVRAVTELFNRRAIPFRTKVVADPGSYVRADAGVLYIERRYAVEAMSLVAEVYRGIRSGLLPSVPMFTKRLADGLGAAEDPGKGVSFGQSRCNAVAAALWSAFIGGISEEEGRVMRIVERFNDEGIDPRFPYLSAGSQDVFQFNPG